MKGDEVYFNEMAPRPHNSGHWTIEGSTTNQFRELCRYLLDMPLEEPQLKAPTVMKTSWDRIWSGPRRLPGRIAPVCMSIFTARPFPSPSARWDT